MASLLIYKRNAVVLNQFLCTEHIGLLLWSSFPITLFHGPSSPQAPHPILLGEVKTALWSLAQITPTLPTSVIRYSPAIYKRVLDALEAFSNTSPVIFSLKGLLKSRLAESLLYGSDSSSQGRFPPVQHPSLPAATAIAVPPELFEVPSAVEYRMYFIFDNSPAQSTVVRDGAGSEVVQHSGDDLLAAGQSEPCGGLERRPVSGSGAVGGGRESWSCYLRVQVFVAEFLDGIRPDFIPYRAEETLRYLCDNIPIPNAKFTKPIKLDLPPEYTVFSTMGL
jgi:hypothetical protein